MKKNLFALLLIIGVVLTSCSKEPVKVFGCTDPTSVNYNPSATDDNGTCQYEGNVTFWYDTNGTTATVNVGGETGYITQYYPTNDPSCGSSGCANFTLPVGSYSFTASSTFSNWSGTVTVTKNGCLLMLLQ